MIDSMDQGTLMNDEARRKIFWLLQRLTSYSLWAKKRDAWGIFARAYEDAVKTWPACQAEQMPADNLPGIYSILSSYNEGLVELAKGNRFVWRKGGAFYRAIHEYRVVSAYLYPHGDYWERGTQQAPYPAKVEILNQLMRASEFHGETAPLELSGAVDGTARVRSQKWLLDPNAYQYGFHVLAYPLFPETLSEIPEGTNVIIRSGQRVPRSGVWEPVRVKQDRILGVIPRGSAEIESIGCFNYFVEGVDAAKISGDRKNSINGFGPLDTHWRLIWADDRYKGGNIPDESEYFIEPKAPAEPHVDEVFREFRTNEICPVSGLWQAVGYKNPPVHIDAGTVMPDLSVRDVKGEMILHYVKWRLVTRN